MLPWEDREDFNWKKKKLSTTCPSLKARNKRTHSIN